MSKYVVSAAASKMFSAIDETTEKKVDTFLGQPSDGQVSRVSTLRSIFFEEQKLYRAASVFLNKLDKYTIE